MKGPLKAEADEACGLVTNGVFSASDQQRTGSLCEKPPPSPAITKGVKLPTPPHCFYTSPISSLACAATLNSLEDANDPALPIHTASPTASSSRKAFKSIPSFPHSSLQERGREHRG